MEHFDLIRRVGTGLLSVALLLTLTACGPGGAVVSPAPTPAPSDTAPVMTDSVSVPSPEASDPDVELSTPATESPEPSPSASAELPALTYEGLAEKVEEVLADLVTDDMSQLEQAKAVYDYTRTHIAYTGDSDKSDWEMGAYVGLTAKRGDCFTYYAVSRALLTYLGIENIKVERVGGISDHYWLLVNTGDGWYHFDSTPRSSKMPAFDSFMFTDEDAAEYTEATGEREYYAFDGSLYPERATEPNPENTNGSLYPERATEPNLENTN